MDAATVDDLFARDRRDDRTALVDATGREFDVHWLCTTSWKSGNFLRHAGVREGVTVGVVGEGPLALVAFFGTTLLEAATRFDPPENLEDEDDFRALVAPVSDLESGEYELPRGAQRVGYGDRPAEPDVHHFDAGLWSENPSFPPLSVDPQTPLLTDGDRTVSHAGALEAARGVIDEFGLAAGDRVVVRAPFSRVETVVAGVIAPLVADGVIVLADDADSDRAEPEPRGEYAVSRASVPEAERIDPTGTID
ncbi:hypothetical protein [Natrarchaeobius oligotrophus]|uniref:Acetyl-CoA synthetase n=1 Tax=Natrarchaeobius chitinivorans TaxID=1679083 RepID=A0A3N6M547_NATCH|nr:hypothetical protein [Natrarchaeobius chitinivorans]RQG98683.1 hypothetical protein EA472_16985 [Natrarchaeobius chitinivorans]